MSDAISDLIERLEAAEGPDREIDRDIGVSLLGWEPIGLSGEPWLRDGPSMWRDEPAGGFAAYTASVDAALALAERVLPGWNFSCGSDWYDDEGPCWARIFPKREQRSGTGNVYAKTPPLALCIAILKGVQHAQ